MAELHSAILRRILAHETERGNIVKDQETGWSRMDTVVRLKNPLDLDFAEEAAAGGSEAHVFRTRDPHYGNDAGVRDGREAVVGPAPPSGDM